MPHLYVLDLLAAMRQNLSLNTLTAPHGATPAVSAWIASQSHRLRKGER